MNERDYLSEEDIRVTNNALISAGKWLLLAGFAGFFLFSNAETDPERFLAHTHQRAPESPMFYQFDNPTTLRVLDSIIINGAHERIKTIFYKGCEPWRVVTESGTYRYIPKTNQYELVVD